MSKQRPRPFPISMIEPYALDMIAQTFPDVEKDQIEVDSVGETIVISGVSRSTEPFYSQEDKPDPRTTAKDPLVKNLREETLFMYSPSAGPVNDGNPHSDYFLVVGETKEKGNLIILAKNECPAYDERDEDTWNGTILVKFFFGGKSREQLDKALGRLRDQIMDETIGLLFTDSFEHNQELIPDALRKIFEKIQEMELSDPARKRVLSEMKNFGRGLERSDGRDK